ncbi:WD repeat- and FYVE domain-containing protein 4 [Latimeria chalumnae]|uniref:WD repeat- and FYVE domain-containing protein 4 n=1 Tax=Latimeria chalumnae TaxID=7897 RepID=UPI00313E0807
MPVRQEEGQIAKEQQVPEAQPDLGRIWDNLGKQYLEYQQTIPFLTEVEQQRKLLRLLLPFLKACEKSAGVLAFPKIQLFASEISNILAMEIQKRILQKPAEEARFVVQRFLQRKGELSADVGWQLLQSVYLLSQTDSGTVFNIIKTGLPVILIRCLYLFFALPCGREELEGEMATPGDSGLSFQELFTETVLSLCSQIHAVEELSSADELHRLLITMSSHWEQCNPSWRSSTASVLRAVSKAQTKNTVKYLQAMNCIRLCLHALSKTGRDLPGNTLVEVVVSVFCFVRDSFPFSPGLLKEFEVNDGYKLLTDVLLRFDKDFCDENAQSVADLCDFIASLTVCGTAELKVSACFSSPQLPHFVFHQPSGAASTVKNIPAFHVLQTVFLKSNRLFLGRGILSAIRKIWTWDRANFFLLEWTLQPLSQFAEVLHLKPQPVQTLYFQLLEFAVFQLAYIPHVALNKVQAIIRENSMPLCTVAALECIYNLSKHDPLFGDIFRDSGLLGTLLAQLRKQAKILRKSGDDRMCEGEDCQRELTCVTLKFIAAVLQDSVRNTVILKDYGMVPYIKIFLHDHYYRSHTLHILEQLFVVNAEEYTSIILGVLCSSTQGDLQLKLDLLQSLLRVLETPKGRSAFRTAGGFEALLSILADMEGALGSPPSGIWATMEQTAIMDLILLTLATITGALHSDPINTHIFHTSGQFEKLAEELQLLGCFSVKGKVKVTGHFVERRAFLKFLQQAYSSEGHLPSSLQSCMKILHFLDHMAKDTLCCKSFWEKRKQLHSPVDQPLESLNNLPDGELAPSIQSLNISQEYVQELSNAEDSLNINSAIVHPGAVCVLVNLLPNVYTDKNPQLSKELQCAVADHIQSMVKTEKIRQLLCDSGLLPTLVTCCQDALINHADPLHLPLIRIFEKLASQSVESRVLRQFLRLGHPLNSGLGRRGACFSSGVQAITHPAGQNGKGLALEASRHPGGEEPREPVFSLLDAPADCALPLHKVVSLVSMTSPRNFYPHKVTCSPSFTEFDMSATGYGCLFLPTLATVMGVNTEQSVVGGLGVGCRGFPPATGITFSCWFLVSHFSSIRDSHPIRILTLVRHLSRNEEHFVCLSISISAPERSLVISTEEEVLQPLDIMEPETQKPNSGPLQVQFSCSKLLALGQWHHLAVVISKEGRRNCGAYLNGQVIGTAKMQYMQTFPGNCTSMEPAAFIDVYGFIGTPAVWKQKSSLVWRLGSTHLLEEVLSMESIQAIYNLGPNYKGSFQSVSLNSELSPAPLVEEEKISFGLNAVISSVRTITDIKHCYNEVDSRLIAKEMGISSRDDSTPVLLARNTAGHLPGPTRTIGAALLSHFGVRMFHCNSAAQSLNFIGGPAVILGLVAMAADDHAMYAAMKVLLSVLNSNTLCEKQMKYNNGYKLLAFLLKKKSRLLSSRIFQLILSIAGTVELGCDSTLIHNQCAFRDILCDFEVWLNAPEGLDLVLFSHFLELLKSSSDQQRNTEVIHGLEMVPKLVFLLNDPSMTRSKVNAICTILTNLLNGFFRTQDILRIGLFLVYTLPPRLVKENWISLDRVSDTTIEALGQTSGRTVWLRNQLLKMLLDLMYSDKFQLCSKSQEDMFLALGSDWFLLFLQGHLHQSTVVLATRLLLNFLCNPPLFAKFRDGMTAGTWKENSAAQVEILMDNLKGRPQLPEHSSCMVPGFRLLQEFLTQHADMPQVHVYLAALFLQKPLNGIVEESKELLVLDSMLQGLLETPNSDLGPNGLCTEAALVLLEMLRSILNKPLTGPEGSWEVTYPGSVMQFFCLVYHSYPNDPLWSCPEFLQALAGTVFTQTPTDFEDGQRRAEAPCANGDLSTQQTSPHPARKQVWDLIRILLMGSLLNTAAHKQLHPFDLLLEASPKNATHEEKRTFQTEVMLSVMDIFRVLSQDAENIAAVGGEDHNDPNVNQEGKAAILDGNVSYFSQKLVDKMYLGMLTLEPKDLLVFITEQVVVVTEKTTSQREGVLNSLFSSLNRTILFSLSRPRNAASDLQSLRNSLKVLKENWDVIFATYNSNISFITCILYCLLQIKLGSYPDGFGVEAISRKVTWHQLLPHNHTETPRMSVSAPALDVEQEVMSAVEAVWEQLIAQRRQALEDTYKLDLSVKQGNKQGGISVSEVTPLWEEAATKAWQQHIASEKRKLAHKGAASQQQPSKSSALSGSLSSAVRSMQKKLTKEVESKTEDVLACMKILQRSGHEVFASLFKEHLQMQQCSYSKAARKWAMIEKQLLFEGGLWGPEDGHLQEKWTLHMAEGPARMRKKIRLIPVCPANAQPDSEVRRLLCVLLISRRLFFFFLLIKCTLFYKAVCYKQGQWISAEMTKSKTLGNEVSVNDSTDLAENVQAGKKFLEGHAASEDVTDCSQLTFFPALVESIQSEEFFELCVERKVILQDLAEGEKITLKSSIVIVEGHILSEGVLLFGKDHFYICENFVLSNSGDVYCNNHLPSSIEDPFLHTMCYKEKGGGSQACSKYLYSKIKELHPRNFLLQDSAVEVFFTDGFSRFLFFHNKGRPKAFKRFFSAVPSLKGRGTSEASINIRKGTGGEKTVLQRWQKGEVNNFEYLIYLNTLAGRTYNDLMQYPIFPWVLADYSSEALDLTNPATFRDLSKPMGAQTEGRKAKFIQRYHEVESNDGNLSAQCHYCTHYSSAIIVSSYLVRLEPFTKTFCSLQGGQDVADRMFHSVKKVWESASRDNMSDVRELIPEFFYLPEFLINYNNFEFGCMQDGTTMGDVVLPPWAKGDPYEFIRLHREALESDYVSANLHHWIDLIFGYKQRGAAAVEVVNIFHPYFYTDQQELCGMKDPLIRSTVLGFVSNFGQIPKQLFTKAHPARSGSGKHPSRTESFISATSGGHSLLFYLSPQSLKPSAVPVKELPRGAVGHIVCTEKGILAVEKNTVLLPPLWNKTFSWGFDDLTCCLGNYGSDKNVTVFEDTADWGQCLCAAGPTPTTLVTAGSSSVVCVWELSARKEKPKHVKLKRALYGHTDAVTCLALSVPHDVMVSGSRDRTCIIWHLSQLTYRIQLCGHKAELSAAAISDLTGEIISCAGTYIHLWNINGQPIAQINTASGLDGGILSCCFAERNEWDSRQLVITGCADGIVRLWKTEYIETDSVAHCDERSSQKGTASEEKNGKKWEKHLVLSRELNRNGGTRGKQSKCPPAVTALTISRDQSKLLVGDESGRVYSWSMEN